MELNLMKMVQYIQGNFIMEEKMELVYIDGQINHYMKENGIIIFCMAMENIFILMVQYIKEVGIIIEWMRYVM